MELDSQDKLPSGSKCSAERMPTAPLLEAAESQRSAGRIDEAEVGYRAVLAEDPENLGALIGLGHILKMRGEREKCLSSFRAAASAHPNVVWPRAELGLFAREIGSLEESEKYLRSCLQDGACPAELTPNLLVSLGCVLRDRGDKREALRNFSEAASLAPSFRWAQLELARAYQAEKDFVPAAEAYQAVLSVSPDDLDATLGLGYLARDNRDRMGALRKFQEAAKVHPREPGPRAEIAVELCALSKFEEAREIYRELLAEFPDHPWGWIGLGQVFRQLGDRRAAVDAFGGAIRQNDKNLYAYIELAAEARENSNFDEAELLAQKALAIDQTLADAWVSIGLTRRERRDYEGATKAFQQAMLLSSEGYDSHFELVGLYQKSGAYSLAKGILNSILVKDAGNANALARLGDISALSLDSNAALDQYQAALRSDPKHPGSYMGIAQALADLGRTTNGLNTLDIAEEQCGRRPEFFGRRAELLRRSGQVYQARTVLKEAVDAYPNIFWLLGKKIEMDIACGSIKEAYRSLESARPSSRRERALWHFHNGQLAESEWLLDDAVRHYQSAINLDSEEAWWQHELARVLLLSLKPKIARTHLEEFARLGAAVSALQGRSIQPSQSHLGQVLDEFLLEINLVEEIGLILRGDEADKLQHLMNVVRNNPDSTSASISFLVFLRQSGLFAHRTAGNYGAVTVPKSIVQFWSAASLPPDLRELTDTWKGQNPDFSYHLFGEAEADQYIAERFPQEVRRAYRRAIEPAQKADIFRLAALFAEGGVYVDIDDRCVAPIKGMLAPKADLLLYQEEYGTVGNNFIGAIPKHPILQRALENATVAINRGDRDLLWLATGPGLLSRAMTEVLVEDDDNLQSMLPRIVIFDRGLFSLSVATHCVTSYKRTAQHWSRSAFTVDSRKKNRT
jgi:tetratricopeptide (TPR) repeat protein